MPEYQSIYLISPIKTAMAYINGTHKSISNTNDVYSL